MLRLRMLLVGEGMTLDVLLSAEQDGNFLLQIRVCVQQGLFLLLEVFQLL